MATRFAGSRCLDERRRRRLAQESVTTVPSAPAPIEPPGNQPQETPQEPETPLPPPTRPTASFLPRSLWKTILLVTAIFAAGTGVVAFGYLCDTETSPLRRVASLSRGSLPRFFSTLCLLASSQLSFLIFWHRAQSRKDFSGRYRIWSWSGLFWMIVCLGAATDLHRLLSRDLLTHWPANLWAAEELCWLTPVAIGHLALVRLLSLEMQQCRASRWFLRLSLVAAVISASAVCYIDSAAAHRVETAVVTGSALLWQTSLLVSLLLHARFVSHTTNEPAPLRQPRWKKFTNKAFECAIALHHRIREKRAAQLARAAAAQAQAEAEAEARKAGAGEAVENSSKQAASSKRHAEPPQGATSSTSPQEADREPPSKTRSKKSRRKGQSEVVTSETSGASDRKVRIDPPQLKPPAAHTAPAPSSSESSSGNRRTQDDVLDDPGPRQRPAPTQRSAESEDDEQDLTHLSRKERRRLRKKQRAAKR